MEEQIYPCSLLEEINSRREMLNEMVTNGIDENVIMVSQELDVLIMKYTNLQLSSEKNSSLAAAVF